VFCGYRCDCMNRLIFGPAFRCEASHCTNHGFVVFSKLLIEDAMKGSMDRHVWQLIACQTLIFFHKSNPYLLIKRQPFFWILV
jgi:hypothetical protein